MNLEALKEEFITSDFPCEDRSSCEEGIDGEQCKFYSICIPEFDPRVINQKMRDA